jgi:hypothetical protein
MRFSTRSMLVTVAAACVVLTALALPTEITAWLASRSYYLAILAAPLGIIFRRGTTRAFWIGFVLFAWGQVALEVTVLAARGGLFDAPAESLSKVFLGNPPPQVPTTPIVPSLSTGAPPPIPPPATGPEEFQIRQWQFIQIGTSVVAMIVDLCGGVLAVYLCRTRTDAASEPANV